MEQIAPEPSARQAPPKIPVVTFRAFAALARQRSWTAESLAERFKGKIEAPSALFHEIMGGRFPVVVIPYRSVIIFYTEQSQEQLDGGHPTCGCGCGRVVFDRKKWATPGCRTKAQRKKVSNGQKGIRQLIDFVKPRLRHIQGMASYPSTETGTNGL